jgi:hypothetical protein
VHVAIGESPERFADEIIAVYQDAGRWLKFSEAGQALIRQQYSMKHGVELVGEILRSIGVKISAEPFMTSSAWCDLRQKKCN